MNSLFCLGNYYTPIKIIFYEALESPISNVYICLLKIVSLHLESTSFIIQNKYDELAKIVTNDAKLTVGLPDPE